MKNHFYILLYQNNSDINLQNGYNQIDYLIITITFCYNNQEVCNSRLLYLFLHKKATKIWYNSLVRVKNKGLG